MGFLLLTIVALAPDVLIAPARGGRQRGLECLRNATPDSLSRLETA